MLPLSLYLGEPGLCLSCASSPKGAASQPEKDCVKLVRPSDSVWPTDAAASFRSLKASPDACCGHARTSAVNQGCTMLEPRQELAKQGLWDAHLATGMVPLPVAPRCPLVSPAKMARPLAPPLRQGMPAQCNRVVSRCLFLMHVSEHHTHAHAQSRCGATDAQPVWPGVMTCMAIASSSSCQHWSVGDAGPGACG